MNEIQISIKLALQNWDREVKRLDNLLEKISNEELLKEVSPGRNTGIYLLGHLIAASESLILLLGLGEKLFPELEAIFIKAPDKSGQNMPGPDVLREMWKKSSTHLMGLLDSINPIDWYNRHHSISEEDFLREPHRNKLSVLLTRTIHHAYHSGQIALLIPKNEPQ